VYLELSFGPLQLFHLPAYSRFVLSPFLCLFSPCPCSPLSCKSPVCGGVGLHPHVCAGCARTPQCSPFLFHTNHSYATFWVPHLLCFRIHIHIYVHTLYRRFCPRLLPDCDSLFLVLRLASTLSIHTRYVTNSDFPA
jgi:hypothetical protein